MACYEIQKYGGPGGLKLVDRAVLEPGDHEVVVGSRQDSLNYRDLVVLPQGDLIVSRSKGGYRFPTEPVKLWQSVRL